MLELLERLGDASAETRITSVSGLLVCRTKLDPISVPDMLVTLLKEESWLFRYILRVIPIEKVIKVELDKMRSCVRELIGKIAPSQTFRITLEKRYCSVDSNHLIRSIALGVNRKVDLHNPDWVVLVEIIQNIVGLSVVKPDGIFSSVVELRKLGTVKRD